MNRRDVEKFYNNYKKNIADISHLEKKLLKESYSYDKWYESIQQQSVTLREIYSENISAYDDVIRYACEHPDELTDDVRAELLVHIDFFLSEGYSDYGVTVPVLRAILPYWESTGNKGKIMDCYYFLGVSLYYSHYYGEACNAFTSALECFDDMMDCPEPYWTYRMICAVYYRFVSYIELNRYSDDILYDYYMEAYEMLTDNRIEDWMMSAKKKEAAPVILRTLLGYALGRMLDQGNVPSEELMGVLVEQFEYESGKEKACMAQVVYSKYLRLTGRMTPTDYEKMLIDIRSRISPQYSLGFTYGLWKFTALYDDELPDESFSEEKLFYIDPSFIYVNFVLSELLSITSASELRDDISRELYKYFLEMPPLPSGGSIDSALYPVMSVLVARCADKELLINCILNLLVHRQMITAIHVTMVARLASIVSRYLANKHPEYFVGLCGLNSEEAVKDNIDKITEFAYNASLCHDLGKLICTDVIRLQNRKILNEEFDRIKNHPTAGASVLMSSETLSEYALVALCHHLYDDGSKGYPSGVSMEDNPQRIMVEIVTVCDSIDAMSDTMGRNYATPKTMNIIIDELLQQSGTRYSARVVSELAESIELMQEIGEELYQNRIQVNYDIYRQYVVPDIKFRPEDEKYISPLQEEDLDSIFAELAVEPEAHKKLYETCRHYSYIVRDGMGNVYGILMCEPDEHNNLWIRQGFVKKDERRQGIGNLLMNYLENVAYDDGIDCIFAPELIQGHYDKFAWHNGFIKSEIDGWLFKKI